MQASAAGICLHCLLVLERSHTSSSVLGECCVDVGSKLYFISILRLSLDVSVLHVQEAK